MDAVFVEKVDGWYLVWAADDADLDKRQVRIEARPEMGPSAQCWIAPDGMVEMPETTGIPSFPVSVLKAMIQIEERESQRLADAGPEGERGT